MSCPEYWISEFKQFHFLCCFSVHVLIFISTSPVHGHRRALNWNTITHLPISSKYLLLEHSPTYFALNWPPNCIILILPSEGEPEGTKRRSVRENLHFMLIRQRYALWFRSSPCNVVRRTTNRPVAVGHIATLPKDTNSTFRWLTTRHLLIHTKQQLNLVSSNGITRRVFLMTELYVYFHPIFY